MLASASQDESHGGGEPVAKVTYRQVRYERAAGSTEIVLVRHGESMEADPEQPFPLVDGRGDPSLSQKGVRQAEALAERLIGLDAAALYITQLRRTAETSAPFARRSGLRPVVAADLVEVHMGEWEGGRYRERIAAGDPLAAEVFRQERWDVIPGAESNEALTKRTSEALSSIAAAHAGTTVVVVTHAVVISSLIARATGARPFAFVAVDNGSISTLVVGGDHWVLRSFNDTSHLVGVDP